MGDARQKKNLHAVALSKLGARKGGLARTASLTPQERTELARKAVNARWVKYRLRTVIEDFNRAIQINKSDRQAEKKERG